MSWRLARAGGLSDPASMETSRSGALGGLASFSLDLLQRGRVAAVAMMSLVDSRRCTRVHHAGGDRAWSTPKRDLLQRGRVAADARMSLADSRRFTEIDAHSRSDDYAL